MKKQLLLASIASVFTLWGCVNKLDGAFDDIHVEASTSMPAGSLAVTDSSIFAMSGVSNQLVPNADGVLAFSMKDDLKLFSDNFINKIFEFPLQNHTFNKEIPGADELPIPPGQLVPVEDIAPDGLHVDITLQISERVDKIIFNEGFIELALDNPNGYDLSQLICETTNLTRNGQTIEIKSGQRIDFNDGAKYEMTPGSGNKFRLNFRGKIPFMSSIGGLVSIWASEIEYMEGYFGRKTVGPESTDVKVPTDFENFTNKVGSVYFANPSFNLDFTSGLEAPIVLLIEKLEAKLTNKSGTTEIIELDFKDTGNRVYIDKKGEVSIKIDNSSFVEGTDNLSTIMKEGLQLISLQTSIIVNPTKEDIKGLGPDPKPDNQVVNIFDAADEIDGAINIEIPIDGVIKDINVANAIDIDFSGLASDDLDFKDLSIAFFGVNGLPLDFSLMASVREGDTETGAQTNLFDRAVIIPASNGKKPGQTDYKPGEIPNTNMMVVKVRTSIIDQLAKHKKMYLDISGSTYDAANMTNVKFYSPTKLDLNMLVGLQADFNITPQSQK